MQEDMWCIQVMLRQYDHRFGSAFLHEFSGDMYAYKETV